VVDQYGVDATSESQLLGPLSGADQSAFGLLGPRPGHLRQDGLRDRSHALRPKMAAYQANRALLEAGSDIPGLALNLAEIWAG
jgi:hypothetical protein